MEDFWLNEAVFNNVAWCNAVATSHGVSTNQNESIWFSEHPMPRFYPNIISLSADAPIDESINAIDPQLPSGWGIKDSYSDLVLDRKRFTVAFEAQWYCRLPNQHALKPENSGLQVSVVQTPSELNRWVTAWGEGEGILNATLLENKAVELVCIERDDRIVAGLAMNQSGDLIGISNMFGAHEDTLGCVTSLIERYPTKGIVGYGDSTELAVLSKIGFEAIGNLRVWLRD